MVLVPGRDGGLFVVGNNDLNSVMLTEGHACRLKAASGSPEVMVKRADTIKRALQIRDRDDKR